MSFWEKNSAILSKQYPLLLEELLREPDSPPEVQIETGTMGCPALKIRGIYVHSPRDPEREGRRLAENIEDSSPIADNEKNVPIVILGFGLGYAAQAAAELWPQRPLIVVEKYRSLLRLAFENRNLRPLLTRNNVAFVLDGEEVASALSLFEDHSGGKTAPALIRNRALTGLDEEWYSAVDRRIRTWAMRDDVNMATLKRFGKRWVCNFSRNINTIRDMPGISRLSGLAGSIPVFLAAAGPGLDQIGALLPEISQRCIVVAVDTSFRFLLKHGVSPDFVVIVDPQFWNSRHLDRCSAGNSRLVAESAVYPPVLRLPFKEKYLCSSLFPLGKFIEMRVDPKGELGAGGSVATSAWDFARVLGAQEVWIAGLDLAFPDSKTHFKGAAFEEKSHAESGLLNPAETWLFRTLQNGLPFWAATASGGKVLTDRRLSLYAAWFENRFRQFPVIRNYSFSAGGLNIVGLESATAGSLLAKPDRRAEINHALEAASFQIENNFFSHEETQKRVECYRNAVSSLVCGLEHIKNAAEKGLKTAEQALKYDYYRLKQNPSQQNRIISSLDAISKSIAESEVKEVAGFLFPPAEAEKSSVADTDGTEHDPFRAYLESSAGLYRSLAESAQYVKEAISGQCLADK
jgi:hypothetical protein